jgi:hypothetical protein
MQTKMQAVSFKAQTNLVVNGDFENATEGVPDGWTCTINGAGFASWELVDVSSVTEQPTKAIKATASGGIVSLIKNFTGLSYDTEYELTFWYQTVTAPESLESNYTTGNRPGLYVNPKYDQQRMKSTGTPASRGYRALINSGVTNDDGKYSGYFSHMEGVWLPASVTFRTPAFLEQADCPADNQYYYTLDSDKGQIEIEVQKSSIIIDDVQLVAVSDVPTGLSAIKAELPVRSENGNLVVSGAPAGSRIDVYSLVGNRLQSAVATQGETTVIPNLPKGQVLIVRNGNEAAKVVL